MGGLDVVIIGGGGVFDAMWLIDVVSRDGKNHNPPRTNQTRTQVFPRTKRNQNLIFKKYWERKLNQTLIIHEPEPNTTTKFWVLSPISCCSLKLCLLLIACVDVTLRRLLAPCAVLLCGPVFPYIHHAWCSSCCLHKLYVCVRSVLVQSAVRC